MGTPSGLEITTSNTTSRIGIFGGTFNPPHVGHLIVAQYALELLQLELLYVVPAYRPPHRSGDVAPFELRFEWCVKTFELKNTMVSDYEKQRGDVSYSLYTVQHFAGKHGCVPYFIVGEDALRYIETWHRYRDLLSSCHFVVYPRYCGKPYQERAKEVLGELFDRIVFLNAPLIEISSSEIRERIRQGKSIKGMVVAQIEESVVNHYGKV
ncbi:nicotinate (nicotinamide) nucleotide adenylyltransferase [Thermotoga caldifontis]|uniref:nicotinate (nicotinamide) nucleotide adenylyltransferase n=1 Tax=Thermotoga caldifontis TaxID=1508419 RepID=UPI0006944A7B|nr:nicotinate (nicotinamide) nucleotide adenylyltransferase [Thermotoga caldifontis]